MKKCTRFALTGMSALAVVAGSFAGTTARQKTSFINAEIGQKGLKKTLADDGHSEIGGGVATTEAAKEAAPAKKAAAIPTLWAATDQAHTA